MIRRWFRKKLPDAQSIEHSFWARPFRRYLSHPNIWALNRHSVPGGVALGLFCGLIPGPFQVLGSLIGSMIFRVNLPTAVLMTFYTNPFNIVPLYAFAVEYGHFLLGEAGQSSDISSMPEWSWSNLSHSVQTWWDWGLNLGPSLVVGLPATMLTFAVVGYVVVKVGWVFVVRWAVVRRRKSQNIQI